MTPEFNHLRDQLDLLRRQMNRLEGAAKARRRWTLPLLTAVLVAGWLIGRGAVSEGRAWAQDEKPAAMEITCKALKVVDDKGKVRVLLTHDKFGGVIKLSDDAGKTIVSVEGDDDGGFVRVSGHDGVERAFLGVTVGKNGGLLALADEKGINRVSMGLNKDNVGALTFRNAGGKSEAFLGASAKGWGGMLNLNNAAGNSSVILDVDDNAWGRMNLRSGDGKMFLFAGADGDGGVVRAFGHDAKERAFFGVGDKQGGGLIYLLGADNNKARLVLGVDGNGVGYAEGRDAAGITRRALR